MLFGAGSSRRSAGRSRRHCRALRWSHRRHSPIAPAAAKHHCQCPDTGGLDKIGIRPLSKHIVYTILNLTISNHTVTSKPLHSGFASNVSLKRRNGSKPRRSPSRAAAGDASSGIWARKYERGGDMVNERPHTSNGSYEQYTPIRMPRPRGRRTARLRMPRRPPAARCRRRAHGSSDARRHQASTACAPSRPTWCPVPAHVGPSGGASADSTVTSAGSAPLHRAARRAQGARPKRREARGVRRSYKHGTRPPRTQLRSS
jgi:hypothetical protein